MRKIKIKTNINLTKMKFNTIELILVVIMALVTGLLIGEICFSNGNNKQVSTIYNEDIKDIEETYETILNNYYQDIDKNTLKQAAINGMLNLLGDNYTNYFNEDTADTFNKELDGEFDGVGISIFQDSDGLATVSEIFENSEADKAGIKVNDKLIKLNNDDLTKLSTSEIATKISGLKESFSLTVKRGEEEKTVNLKVGKVTIKSVSSNIIETEKNKIGYIKLDIFALNTDEQFKEELTKMKNNKITKLIIDLRDNSGGHLDTTINIASEFLNKNQIICQIQDKTKTTKLYSTKNNDYKFEIVILVNELSASASEVLSAALQEEYNAILVGVKTFGKGTVQTTYDLSKGTMIKYTSQIWLTSHGNSINKTGIKPNIEEKMNDKYYETRKLEDDNQYQKAVEILDK